MVVYLYSTVGCHLCEKAKSVLWPLLGHYQYSLKEIDIADDDKLIEKYGIRIPVLAIPNCSEELNWPFNTEQADDFLRKMLTNS